MRSVVLTATLATVLWLGLPPQVSAQDPPPPPPPQPAPREPAVPRSERMREPQVRTRESSDENRSSGGAVERQSARERQANSESPARREAASTTQAERRRAPANSGAAVNASDEQRSGGAERRGSVRRPPSGGSSSEGSRTADRAVPRSSVPRRNEPIFVYPSYRTYNRYYDPWGYGAFGLGYFYYSPWAWNPGYYGYPGYGGRYGAYGYDLGSVKLKVKPRDAEVFVDNYFAGQVDDFDGFFQALKLDSGGYRIEIRKSGFETLRFDVRVQPERTITFRGEMKPLP